MDIALAFLLNHWTDILAVYGAVVAAASTIVKLTPSQSDDAVLAKVVGVLDFLSTVPVKKG